MEHAPLFPKAPSGAGKNGRIEIGSISSACFVDVCVDFSTTSHFIIIYFLWWFVCARPPLCLCCPPAWPHAIHPLAKLPSLRLLEADSGIIPHTHSPYFGALYFIHFYSFQFFSSCKWFERDLLPASRRNIFLYSRISTYALAARKHNVLPRLSIGKYVCVCVSALMWNWKVFQRTTAHRHHPPAPFTFRAFIAGRTLGLRTK